MQVDGHATTLVLGDPEAHATLGGGGGRGELWRAQIGDLTVRNAEPDESLVPVIATGDEPTGQVIITMAPPDRLDGGEPIAEGGRRVLRRFFDRMLARERAVLQGDDAEDVHQMRVASRRLRAALQVVEAVYDPEQVRPLPARAAARGAVAGRCARP